jgi:ectoine hydroxylase
MWCVSSIRRDVTTDDDAGDGARMDADGGGGTRAVRPGALHQLAAVTACPELAFLLDHPAAFRYIWPLLSCNIHVYHAHIDVHPRCR